MKILFLLPGLTNAGPANVVASLINSDAYKDHEIVVCCFLGVDENYVEGLSHKNLKIIKLNGFNFTSLCELRNIIKNENISVLHSHCLLPDIASAIVCKFTPYKNLSTVHCDLKADYSKEYPFIKANIFYVIHNFFLFFIKKKISVSKGVANKLLLSSSVIYNGVKKRIVKKQKNKDSVVHLIFAGRLIPRKNIIFLLDTFKEIGQGLQHKVILHVYGEGELFDEVYQYQSETIIIHGFCDDFIAQMPKNAIFINPSLAEGMPMAVLEAIAAGFPVLLSSIEPHIEIKNKMRSGVELFDFTQDSIEQSINRLLSKSALINYDDDIMANDFESYFSNVKMSQSYIDEYTKL